MVVETGLLCQPVKEVRIITAAKKKPQNTTMSQNSLAILDLAVAM